MLGVPTVPRVVMVILGSLYFCSGGFAIRLGCSSVFATNVRMTTVACAVSQRPSHNSVTYPFTLALLLGDSHFFVLFDFVV